MTDPNQRSEDSRPVDARPQDGWDGKQVRPIGAWVIGGFVTLSTLVMWTLVAVIFHVRS